MIGMNNLRKKKYTNILKDDGAFAFCDVPFMWMAEVIPPMLGRCVPLLSGAGGELGDMFMRVINKDTIDWINEIMGR